MKPGTQLKYRLDEETIERANGPFYIPSSCQSLVMVQILHTMRDIYIIGAFRVSQSRNILDTHLSMMADDGW
jgi:hypothetical protein